LHQERRCPAECFIHCLPLCRFRLNGHRALPKGRHPSTVHPISSPSPYSSGRHPLRMVSLYNCKNVDLRSVIVGLSLCDSIHGGRRICLITGARRKLPLTVNLSFSLIEVILDDRTIRCQLTASHDGLATLSDWRLDQPFYVDRQFFDLEMNMLFYRHWLSTCDTLTILLLASSTKKTPSVFRWNYASGWQSSHWNCTAVGPVAGARGARLFCVPRGADERPESQRVPAPCWPPLVAHAEAARAARCVNVDTDRAVRGGRFADASHPSSLARSALHGQAPKVGAECLNRARWDLCGGRAAMRVPTAIQNWRPEHCVAQ
jgi:hypothetical protein